MKLSLKFLKNYIELPDLTIQGIRHLLDDLGLEVKDQEDISGDTCFTIETLAHRGDHLSVLGTAREISARYLTPLKIPTLANNLPENPTSKSVKVTSKLCLRYGLLELELPANLKLSDNIACYLDQPDPERPAIVHILNFAQQELGQPMHAFDYDLVEGEVVVVESTKPEKILALDNKEYEVPAGSILICDSKKIIAVAGVIGCANSMVSNKTKSVLIEAALFDPVAVRKTARRMGISTDASYLFERGADWAGVELGLRRVLSLLSQSKLKGYSIINNAPLEAKKLSVSLEQIRKELNRPSLTKNDVQTKLEALGYKVVWDTDCLAAEVPTWRYWNVQNPAVIIEDIARSFSFNSITPELPPLSYNPPPKEGLTRFIEQAEQALLAQGFNEVITRSYYSSQSAELICEFCPELKGEHVKLNNSLDGAYTDLKLTNLIHFANLAERNHRQGIRQVKVYELGRFFKRSGFIASPYEFEQDVLTMACSGRWYDNEWKKPETLGDTLSLFQGAVQGILKSLGIKFSVHQSSHGLLHPGQQAELRVGTNILALFGVIHPSLARSLDLGQDLFYAEIYPQNVIPLEQLFKLGKSIDFPQIRRDITLKVPERLYAEEVCGYIVNLAPKFLKAINLIDTFKKSEEDFRRVTYRLTFQNNDRTLEHKEIDQVMNTALEELSKKHNIQMIG